MGWDRTVSTIFSVRNHFNPPTPHGGGRLSPPITSIIIEYLLSGNISIHPPRMGWDEFSSCPCAGYILFQSTHPAWGGTRFHFSTISLTVLPIFQSTHPAWGGTRLICRCLSIDKNFNPPTPHGVGPDLKLFLPGEIVFQSTHPAWGGTN